MVRLGSLCHWAVSRPKETSSAGGMGKNVKCQFQGIEWKAKSLIPCSLQRKSNSRFGSHLYLSEREVQSTYEPFLSMRRGRTHAFSHSSPTLSMYPHRLRPLFIFFLSLHPCLLPIQLTGIAWLEACLFPQGSSASGSRQ